MDNFEEMVNEKKSVLTRFYDRWSDKDVHNYETIVK